MALRAREEAVPVVSMVLRRPEGKRWTMGAELGWTRTRFYLQGKLVSVIIRYQIVVISIRKARDDNGRQVVDS
jgi:hypothetical protein